MSSVLASLIIAAPIAIAHTNFTILSTSSINSLNHMYEGGPN